jgi:hypothetical protein
VLAVALLAPLLAAPASQAAVAPGCTAAQPTRVGGTIRGYPDNRYVDTHIGIQVTDVAGRTISPTGTLVKGGYSWIEMLNNNVSATGTTDSTIATDKWGRCVTANARSVYIEAYPKRADQVPAIQVTDQSRYGETAYYGGKITPGAVNTIGLRLPATYQATGGNTGGLQGYLWHAGQYVPAGAITRVRAFTQQPGPTCGVEGLAASAEALASATGPNRTYYKVDFLSAGQCGAPYQVYSLQMTCHLACGATDRNVATLVGVRRGQWPRVDVVF